MSSWSEPAIGADVCRLPARAATVRTGTFSTSPADVMHAHAKVATYNMIGRRRRCSENRLSAGEIRLSTLSRRSDAFIDVVGPFQCGAKRVG
jgi:hypothetical protein